MTQITIHFANGQNANSLVAGIPAAARAVYMLVANGMLKSGGKVQIAASTNWEPSDFCRAELARIAPDIEWHLCGARDTDTDTVTDTRTGLAAGMGMGKDEAIHAAGLFADAYGVKGKDEAAVLRQSGGAIIAATGKPTDGWVSYYCNRPVSQFCSRLLLRLPFIRPIHATAFAGLIGVIMATCLAIGGQGGLIAAAILFQCASIIDGVDGEIARATMRTSKLGATLDTACDAVTNFAFIGGVVWNVWRMGDVQVAWLGLAGLGALMIGLAMLGRRSLRAGGGLSFDALKVQAHAQQSALLTVLAKITSRDFYVLALAILIAIGLAQWAIVTFAIAAIGWFIFAAVKLLKTR